MIDCCIFIEQCSLSSSVPVDLIHSYTSTSILIVLLYVGSIVSSAWAQWVYSNKHHDQFVKPYRWFRWCRMILICLVSASICNQLVSALSCRPIRILYDIRYISMLIVQITGVFVCLLFAFFLGVKYASIDHRNQLQNSSQHSS